MFAAWPVVASTAPIVAHVVVSSQAVDGALDRGVEIALMPTSSAQLLEVDLGDAGRRLP